MSERLRNRDVSSGAILNECRFHGRDDIGVAWRFREAKTIGDRIAPERVDNRRCDDRTDARASITARRNRVNAACSRVVFCRQYATEDFFARRCHRCRRFHCA